MDAFVALADPTRREILRLLSLGPMDAGAIATHFMISKPAISKHLKRLYEGALVTRRVDAQKRVYAVDPTGFDDVERWIHTRRAAWENHLDKLDEYLEKKNDKTRQDQDTAKSSG